MRPSSQKLLSELATLPHFEQLSRSRAGVTTFVLRYSCLRPLKHSILLPSSLLARSTMADEKQPWYGACPQARSNPESISRSKVLELLKEGKEAEKLVLVDLRRTDYEVRSDRECMTSIANRLASDQHYRVVPSKALSICQLKACTQRSHRYTLSSKLLASGGSFGIAVCLSLKVVYI